MFAVPRMLALVALSALVASAVSAQEWTRFRGPNGTGESEAKGIPAKWSQGEEAWRVKLPGQGNGSPVLWGDKIFLLSGDPETASRYVLCLNAKDGSTIWQQKFNTPAHHLHGKNTYATSTPAVDANRVYVAWATDAEFLVLAFDHAGKLVWQKNLGSFVSDHGFGTSPMLIDDLVVLNNHQNGDKLAPGQKPGLSSMVALDAKTGEIRWQTPRETKLVCYSVPCVLESSLGKELICTSTSHGMFSLNPKTGKENWSLDVFQRRTVSSPIFCDGVLLGTNGDGSGKNYVVGVKPGPNPKEVFRIDRSMPYCPTPVCAGKLVFLWSDQGVVTCIDGITGKQEFQQRIGGTTFSSPIRVGKVIYGITEAGEVVALAAEPKFAELGRSPLGETCRSTPAVANGKMYIRTLSQLVCIGKG